MPCIIELDHSALNDLRVFHENRRVFAGGEVLPFDERGLPHRRPAVVLSAPPGESTVYIRMTGPSPRRIPLRIYAPADFEMMAALDLTWLGIFYGALAMMAIYNLLLFFTIGEREYAYLSAFIVCVLMGYMKIEGTAFQYLWPHWPLLNYSYNLIFAGGMISILLFFGRFLNTRYHAPLLHRAGKVLLGFCVLVIVTFPVQIMYEPLRIYTALYGLLPTAVALSVSSFFVALYVWRRGNPAGLYISLAVMTSSFIGNLWYLEWLGLVGPLGLISRIGAQIGFVAYVALLGFGTGQRIRAEIRSLQRLNTRWQARARKASTAGAKTELPRSRTARDDAPPAEVKPAPNANPPSEPQTTGGDWTITPRTEEKLKLAREYLREHFLENVSREELAARVELNSDNLGRFFKMYTGEKLGDYVNRLRIEEAARRLDATDEKIIDVAFAAGFESLKTFNRNFSAFMSMTPSRYRRRKQESARDGSGPGDDP